MRADHDHVGLGLLFISSSFAPRCAAVTGSRPSPLLWNLPQTRANTA
jgi:hypothetical protein